VKVSTSVPFLLKDPGAPDAWRIAIYLSDRGSAIAYAVGGDKEEAEANAALLVKALGGVK
jgi:hypothetical protein